MAGGKIIPVYFDDKVDLNKRRNIYYHYKKVDKLIFVHRKAFII